MLAFEFLFCFYIWHTCCVINIFFRDDNTILIKNLTLIVFHLNYNSSRLHGTCDNLIESIVIILHKKIHQQTNKLILSIGRRFRWFKSELAFSYWWFNFLIIIYGFNLHVGIKFLYICVTLLLKMLFAHFKIKLLSHQWWFRVKFFCLIYVNKSKW